MNPYIFLVILAQSAAITGQPTPGPFANEIAAFKQQDIAKPPARGQILFIGSSSFTRWTDVSSYFPNHSILNRAFGGSSLPDMIRYANDVIFPYQPKQVVIYCGENDFAGDPKLPAYKVFDRFTLLFSTIRQKLPDVPIAYISMKPSPSRWAMRAKFVAANGWIRQFCATQKKTAFIDVWDAMLDERGNPLNRIFVSDKLHMNSAGYRIWQPIIEPYLLVH